MKTNRNGNLFFINGVISPIRGGNQLENGASRSRGGRGGRKVARAETTKFDTPGTVL